MLRGINVGKGKRIAMADLRSLLEGLGYDDVTTVVQSGNASFAAKERSAAKVQSAIAGAISSELGLDVDVIVRTGAQMTKVVTGNPFPAAAKEPATLHVMFLDGPLTKAARTAIDGHEVEPEEIRPAGDVIYARYPNGLGRSTLTLSVWARLLGKGTVVTDRNWNTVTKLEELAR
jgi:uncharacterized protein (DUF1697 family)